MHGHEQIQSGCAAICTFIVAAAGLLIVIPVIRKVGLGGHSERVLEFRGGLMRYWFGGSVIYGFLGTLVLISISTLIGMSPSW